MRTEDLRSFARGARAAMLVEPQVATGGVEYAAGVPGAALPEPRFESGSQRAARGLALFEEGSSRGCTDPLPCSSFALEVRIGRRLFGRNGQMRARHFEPPRPVRRLALLPPRRARTRLHPRFVWN